MNRLAGLRTYLIGSMDRALDGGVGWRKSLTPWLEDKGVVVLDPTDKPICHAKENEYERATRQAWKINGDWELLSEYVREIRTVDLRMVDVADFLIAWLDLEVFMCGSFEEIFLANRMKKPVLIVCAQGKSLTPDWLFGTVPHQNIFGSIDEMKEYLIYIDEANEVDTLNRWVFFDQKKLYTPAVVRRLQMVGV